MSIMSKKRQLMSTEEEVLSNEEEGILKEILTSESKKEITEVQELFLLGKNQLKEFEEIKATRPLTQKEKAKEDDVKYKLFLAVKKYAIQIMNSYISKYIVDSDAREDIMSGMADMFYNKLESYDPMVSTPTTFFKVRFMEVVRNYITENSQHLTQNDANHLKILNQAIKACEAQGIEYDDDILKQKTGLSYKIIKKTKDKANSTAYASLDSALEVTSKELTPEEIFIQNEENEMLHKLISETLSPDEIEFFFTYLNIGEAKVKDYKELMAIYNMPEHEVKSKISNIQAKLMLELNSNREKSKIQLSLHDNVTNEIEETLLQEMDSIELTNEVPLNVEIRV